MQIDNYMKRYIMIALVLLAGASFSTQVNAKDKKDKKKTAKTEQKVEALKLVSSSDSVSYAAGMAVTEGLVPYLKQSLNVDTAYMADFISGFKESVSKGDDPHVKARAAGAQIASMVNERMLPQVKGDLVGTADSLNSNLFVNGFIAALEGDTTLYKQPEAQKFFRGRIQALKDAKDAENKKENEDWLKNNAKKEGFKTTASGLQYKVLREGKGATPKKTDKVKVKYEGRMIDGTVFDSSYKRNPPTSEFRCDEVIKGWTEALTMMPVGSKWEIVIPQELAYGNRQAGKIKPYSTLVFTVELDSIEAAKK